MDDDTRTSESIAGSLPSRGKAARKMHCLRWWLPIFLLPLPAASPFLLLLFLVSYVLRTKPCVYCSVIILSLMFSSCSFYHLSPLNSIIGISQSTSSTFPDEISHVSLRSTVTPSSLPPASDDIITTTKDQRRKKIANMSGPSSCWIDLSSHKYSPKGKMDLGRWSAPTWRRHRSVLSQAKFNSDEKEKSKSQTKWQRLLREGIFIGYEDVGFRLKFGLE